jgi:MFS family permease
MSTIDSEVTARPPAPASRLRSYAPVLSQPVLRRILPGLAVSALGDGMSVVAVAWLAVQIAPADQAAAWTGLAVAAYTLPATIGAAVFGRLVRRFHGARLVAVDASVRAVALGTTAVLAVADRLSPAGYVLLLAGSSLLHAWGSAGRTRWSPNSCLSGTGSPAMRWFRRSTRPRSWSARRSPGSSAPSLGQAG